MTTSFADLFKAATCPMQGPLTSAQELKLATLKATPWDGKALAIDFESKLRHKAA
jgi:hypothetical protein